MRLILLGRQKWTVYAICNERGDCSVLDTLASSGDAGIRLLADLREYVPVHGPGFNEEFSKALRDGVCEFRQPTSRGGTPRVLYFYDRGHVIVCTVAVLKKDARLPEVLIDQAVDLREQFRGARERNQLMIDHIDDTDDQE